MEEISSGPAIVRIDMAWVGLGWLETILASSVIHMRDYGEGRYISTWWYMVVMSYAEELGGYVDVCTISLWRESEHLLLISSFPLYMVHGAILLACWLPGYYGIPNPP